MTNGSREYSDLKVAWHVDAIKSLRETGLAVPPHLQIIISDLCNEDCSFCLVGDTLIATPTGNKRIDAVSCGDLVYGIDGTLQTVTRVGKRMVNQIYRISVGGQIAEASAEHPFLSENGWTKASDLRIGDSAAVRVRLRAAGALTSRPVERLSGGTSAGDSHEGGRTTTRIAVNARSQSDEESRSGSAGSRQDAGATSPQVGNRSSQHFGSGTRSYAIRPEPYARSGYQPASGDSVYPSLSVKNGVGIREVVSCSGIADIPDRRRVALDRSQESRFSRERSGEGYRIDTEGSVYREEKIAHDRIVCVAYDKSLPVKELELPSGIYEGSDCSDQRPAERDSRIYLNGVELERGLGLRPIDSIEIINGLTPVYNFACEPGHAYEANGIVVHNCAYRMTGYTSNANFGVLRADGTLNNNPARFIPLLKAKEILEDAVSMGVEAVEITGGGEPTVHPHHAEIFRHALDVGLECALVSNGVRLLDPVRRILPGFAWVRYSLDAGNPQTYAAMRGVKPQWFDQVLKNARALADEIKAAKSPTVFGISFIVTKENYRETYEAAQLAADVGAQYIRYGAIFTPELADYYTPDMLMDAQGGIELAQASLQRPGGFRIINMLNQRVGDLEQGRPDYQFCGYQHLNMYIGGDLNVYRCCNTAYNDLGLTGSLKDQTFRQFMESEGRAKAYKEFNAQACKHCAFNDKNRILNYLVDKNPRHVNFA